MKRRVIWLLLAAVLLALGGCAAGETAPQPEEPENQEEVTVLTYAILDPKSVNKGKIDKFNRTHTDVRIVTKNYVNLSEDGKQGADLLTVELATGKVPDIIDFGSDGQLCQLPYRSLAEKGYLEDLWPYIENDPDIGRKRVMESFLGAAEVNGGLYMLYPTVRVCTLLGAEAAVGDRTSWSLEDLREAFAALPEGDTVLDNVTDEGVVPSMRQYLLTRILSGFTGRFVDFETGECSFDGQPFRDLLAFLNSIPDTPREYGWLAECDQNDFGDVSAMHALRLRKQEVLLELEDISNILTFRSSEVRFGQRAVPVGYPLGEGAVGSYITPCGSKLAISSSCKDKEAAWELLRELITFDFGKRIKLETYNTLGGLPVSKPSYTLSTRSWYSKTLAEEAGIPDARKGTKAELEQVNGFLDSITSSSLFLEPSVLALIQEEAGAYFAGDLTLDQAAERIQNRASLYVNERR